MCNTATGDSQTANSLTADQKTQNLERFFKKRRRDESVVKTAKTLLVHGMTPGKVALLLRLDPDFIAELAKTWNPRFRRVSHANQYTAKRMARMYYESGALLATICRDLQLPLYTVVAHLKAEGVTEQQMAYGLPDRDDPLYVEYIKTVKRHANRKQKSPQLH